MELSASKAAEIRAIGSPVLLLSKPQDIQVVKLNEGLLTIGTDQNCDLTLQQDHLEPRHAVFQSTDTGFEVFNLSSSGDTLKNGRKTEAAALSQGDEIRLGSVRLTYIDPNADIMPAGCQLLALPLEFLRSQAILDAEASRNAHDESFNDVLVDALKRSPWMLISCAVHALIYITILSTMPAPDAPKHESKIEVDMEVPDVVDAPLDEIEVDVLEPEVEFIDEPVEMLVDMDEDFESLESMDESDSDDLAKENDLLAGMGTFRPLDGNMDGVGDFGHGIGIPVGLGERVRQKVQRLQESGLEVVVLLDATGSMDAEIESAKQQIVTLIASLQAMGIDFRLGVVAFRDKGEEYVTKKLPLTRQVYKAVDFMDGLRAMGGGDEPEAVLAAITDATRMRFAQSAEKVIILVGDAPPKPKTIQKVMRKVSTFAARGGHIHTIYTNSDPNNHDWSGTRKIFEKISASGAGASIRLRGKKKLIANILSLMLETGSTDKAIALMKQIETGPRARLIRRRVRKFDKTFVGRTLSKSPIEPQIPLELLRHNHETYLATYFAVLNLPNLPQANRWLTTVLLKRLLRQVDRYRGIGQDARDLMRAYDPESSPRLQKSVLSKLKQNLYDTGLLILEAKKH